MRGDNFNNIHSRLAILHLTMDKQMNKEWVINRLAYEIAEPLSRKWAKKITEEHLGYELDDRAKSYPYQQEIGSRLCEVISTVLRNLSEPRESCDNTDKSKSR